MSFTKNIFRVFCEQFEKFLVKDEEMKTNMWSICS